MNFDYPITVVILRHVLSVIRDAVGTHSYYRTLLTATEIRQEALLSQRGRALLRVCQ